MPVRPARSVSAACFSPERMPSASGSGKPRGIDDWTWFSTDGVRSQSSSAISRMPVTPHRRAVSSQFRGWISIQR
jgi:hypothetical protein